MREDCKHYESRTYSSGEVVRFCELDLAPEAPWRCPDDCPAYERRLAGAAWEQGSVVEPPIEAEPDEAAEDVVNVLEQAEDIVDAVLPETLGEVEREEDRSGVRSRPGRRWPWRRRS